MAMGRILIRLILCAHASACLSAGASDRTIDLGDWTDAATPDAASGVDAGSDAADASPDTPNDAAPDGEIHNPPECPATAPPPGTEPCSVGRTADGGCVSPPVSCTYP